MTRSMSLAVMLTLLAAGCTGGGSSPIPAPGSSDGGWLSYTDGSAWLQPDSAPAWSLDIGASATVDSAPAAPDAASSQPPSPPSSQPPSPPPPQGCANGDLMATLPGLPSLCRPFPPPAPHPASPDPPSCQATPQLTLTTGPDQFTGSDTVKDWIRGLDGDDKISGMGCSDEINGNQGDDWINGNMGDDVIHGGQGNDTLHGGKDNDAIYGDLGNDTVSGDLHDDQYYYAEGEGHDVIEETGGYDQIVCAANNGRPRARLVGWSRVGNDLLLIMSGSGSIRVKDYYVNADRSVELIVNCQ